MKLFVIASFLVFCNTASYGQTQGDSLLNFITQNKNRASIYLVCNNLTMAHLNENNLMPLASTMKILIAIEFAKQVSGKKIQKDGYVALKELDKYYLPNTDGGAHPKWISYERSLQHIKIGLSPNEDSIKLIDVARGMILFSSNANTEYLLDLLGVEKVNDNIKLFGLNRHTLLYPIVSSLFLYQNHNNRDEKNTLRGIDKLSAKEYFTQIINIHSHLKNDPGFKATFSLQDLSLEMQKAWSDRLPASTTKEYTLICKMLNNRKLFDAKTYDILSEELESLMENPANRSWLKHAGMKGGSTIWVLTRALYATTNTGTTIEMAYFFNNLTMKENGMLQHWMNQFELETLSSETFRQKINSAFN